MTATTMMTATAASGAARRSRRTGYVSLISNLADHPRSSSGRQTSLYSSQGLCYCTRP